LTLSDSESIQPSPFHGLDERQEKRDIRAASLSPKEPDTPKPEQGLQKKGLFRALFKKSIKNPNGSTKNTQTTAEKLQKTDYKRMDLKSKLIIAILSSNVVTNDQ
jgi:hypothetical protein